MVLVCLFYVFKVVEIDGEVYWDGGYMGNLLLFLFIDEIEVCDVVIV